LGFQLSFVINLFQFGCERSHADYLYQARIHLKPTSTEQ